MAREIDSLIEYLREHHNIIIDEEKEKQQLRNIGYYHGYKGYRYIGDSEKKIEYTKFEELMAVYTFDMNLKSLLYTKIMFIETALKNYVLEVVLNNSKSEYFNDIYEDVMTDYKSFISEDKIYKNQKEKKRAEEKYKASLVKRMQIRDRILSVKTRAYANKNKIALHFIRKGVTLPIWAIFELISLSEFAGFLSCLNLKVRDQISKNLNINSDDDLDRNLVYRLISSIKNLRNSIAHNEVIFDVRFKTKDVDSEVLKAVKNATQIPNVTFETITDYFVLTIYMLKFFKLSDTELYDFIEEFEKLIKKLKKNVSSDIFESILNQDVFSKIAQLKNYIKRKDNYGKN